VVYCGMCTNSVRDTAGLSSGGNRMRVGVDLCLLGKHVEV